MMKIWNHVVKKDSQATRKEWIGNHRSSQKFWKKKQRGQKPWQRNGIRSSQRNWDKRSVIVLLNRRKSKKWNNRETIWHSSSWVSSIRWIGLQQELSYNQRTGTSNKQLSRFVKVRMYQSHLYARRTRFQLKRSNSKNLVKEWRSLHTWSTGTTLATANTTICTLTKTATIRLHTRLFRSQSSNFS